MAKAGRKRKMGYSVDSRRPVRTSCGGRNELAHISMTVQNEASEGSLRVVLETDRPLDRLPLRLGPFERGRAGMSLRWSVEATADR